MFCMCPRVSWSGSGMALEGMGGGGGEWWWEVGQGKVWAVSVCEHVCV